MNRTLWVLLSGALLIATVAVATGIQTQNPQSPNPLQSIEIPVVVEGQLAPENGVIPVELKCGTALLTSPNTMQEFSCVVKNNTNKNILALSAAYIVTTENEGRRSSSASYLSMDSFIHADIREARGLRSIAPRQESVLRPSGPITYQDEIRGVEVRMDYVEFEDRTTLGPDTHGSQIINLTREGAARYREWLNRKYLQNRRSVNAIIRLLQEQQIPGELGFNDRYLDQGAMVYRRQMLNVYSARGAAALQQFLNRSQSQ